MSESAEEKFVRLATARTNKVLEHVRLLANLSSPNYKSTMEQRRVILKALRSAIDELEYSFSGEHSNDKAVFRFEFNKQDSEIES